MEELFDIKKNQREFSDLWAIVLGGSSGFGYAAVEKLASHGMNIAVLYRETAIIEKELREKFPGMAQKYNVSILPLNINALDNRNRSFAVDQLSQIVNKAPVIKLLLHSIARGSLKPLFQSDPEQEAISGKLSIEDIQLTAYAMSASIIDWATEIREKGLFHQDARIIGLTSEGSHKYWKGYAAVGMAKAMLESLLTYMAVELSPYGLKTNLIQAGITETPSLKKIPDHGRLIELSAQRNPMGRITKAEDVANVIYLLCKDEAAWINGTIVTVDGGEHCI